ncbi:ATP12 family chaperone protein [Pseudoroseomonas cervicalis]|uniref:ATP12 family chaperone protein n=1 Tax=Teichococcus cervicalis TaxID=204525 RepID=UPI0022F14C8E|nr:ATP12 family protein [Pseudoroseomonas cervicalis]WBV42499.1 chaperone, ATP12 [Pseudoroseomonas cervicalis]
MKRFWDRAEALTSAEGFAVQLDGRPLRLPGSGPLRLPSLALAEAVAEEWQAAGGAKGGEMTMEQVPLTRVVATGLERIAADPEASVAALAEYGGTDLLCYHAAGEPRLAERQAREWQPLLDWAALALDAPLKVTSGIMPVAQPPESLAALRRALAGRNALELAALGVAIPALGSLVLGLALAEGRLDAAEACRLAFLDESFQQELWGEDAEALARQDGVVKDVALAARLLVLARG